ncbi:MAG: hypothetical protein ACKVVP_02670 [Chloroflexota bacterium]
MKRIQAVARMTAGLALILTSVTTPAASADPSQGTTFQGCVLESTTETLVLRTSGVPTVFNLTRISANSLRPAEDDCITVRAYPGGGSEAQIWFAESIEEGDERIETTGREITQESTRDSTAKSKRNKPD